MVGTSICEHGSLGKRGRWLNHRNAQTIFARWEESCIFSMVLTRADSVGLERWHGEMSTYGKEESGMYGAQEQRSEVARLLTQISAEYEAAQRGLSGLAYGTSQHAFITQKMENMGRYHQELQNLVGEMPAIAMIAEQLDALPERGQPSS